MTQILAITDGTTKVTLLGGIGTFYLDPDRGWQPALPEWKGAGTWQSSPLSDGRWLVNRQFGNVTDSIGLTLSDYGQDQLIYGLQQLFILLEKAVKYSVTQYQNDPVWIEARASCETETRYAIVYAWNIPELDDPYRPPFDVSADLAGMEDITLSLEHSPWMAYEPGSEACLQLSATQPEYDTTGDDDSSPTAQADDGEYIYATNTLSIIGTTLRMGINGTTIYEAMIRFIDVAVPQGATITEAYVTLECTANSGGPVTTSIVGELNASPAVFSTNGVADYQGRARTEARVSWPIPDIVSGVSYDSDDIANIIQEITDLSTWASGDDIALFFEFDRDAVGYATWASFDHLTANAPILHVEYVDTSGGTYGRDATCTNEVYFSNHQNRAALTHIFLNDAVTGFGLNLLGSALPYTLISGNGDEVYFGIQTSHNYSGPFCSLVFDLVSGGALQGIWQWYNGAQWLNFQGALGAGAEETDHTVQLNINDVNSLTFEQPLTWAAGAVNAITAFWVRLSFVSAGAANWQQQNRDVYAVTWNHIDIAAAQLPGTMATLARALIQDQGDNKQTLDPDLHDDRVVLATRSVSRGSDFESMINCSDVQNPPTITVKPLDTNTAIAGHPPAPTGRALYFSPGAATAYALQERADIKLSGPLAVQYYGIFHLWVRCKQAGISGGYTGDVGDFTLRIKLSTGSRDNVVWTSDSYTMRSLQLVEAVDFGEVTISPGRGISTQFTDVFFIIEVSALSNSTPSDLIFYDLVLMPIDEFAGDFVNAAISRDAALEWSTTQHKLDVTSHNYKRMIEALLTSGDDQIIVRWLTIANQHFALQPRAAQRLHTFTMKNVRITGTHDGGALNYFSDASEDFEELGVAAGDIIYNTSDNSSAIVTSVDGSDVYGTLSGGTNNSWVNGDVALIITALWESSPYDLHSIQMYKQPRWLAMRGADA